MAMLGRHHPELGLTMATGGIGAEAGAAREGVTAAIARAPHIEEERRDRPPPPPRSRRGIGGTRWRERAASLALALSSRRLRMRLQPSMRRC